MRTTNVLSIVLAAGVLAPGGLVPAQTPMGTAFNYNGNLTNGGAPVNGTCDFEFTLWTAATGGVQLGPTLAFVGGSAIAVTEGQFTVKLDFGGDPFVDPLSNPPGSARWAEIKVRCPSGAGAYTTLVPRDQLDPTPYAFFGDWAQRAFDLILPWAGTVSGGVAGSATNPALRAAAPGGGAAFSVTNTGAGGALFGASTNGPGVTGASVNSTGVFGASSFSDGVLGNSVSGRGVYGYSRDNVGVLGASENSVGVRGTTSLSDGVQGIADGGTGAGVYGRAKRSGVYGVGTDAPGEGVLGRATSLTGETQGVYGSTESTGILSSGVRGEALADSGFTFGVYGRVPRSPNGTGVRGYAEHPTGNGIGVSGESKGDSGMGVFGRALSTTGLTFGVAGTSFSSGDGSSGVRGESTTSSGLVYGVRGIAKSTSNSSSGVCGESTALSGFTNGVCGSALSPDGNGVYGHAQSTTGPAWGVFGRTQSSSADAAGVYGWAAGPGFAYGVYSNGDCHVAGTLTKTAGAFKIDHPLDPENKYLVHSFVESPDMMNIYNGNVMLEENGEAWVELPEWFEALNQEFRYQLTAMGQPAPHLFIAEEIADNRFKIGGGPPAGRVSWLVTGVRHDPFAQMNRIQVEEQKPTEQKGRYMHPEVYGEPESKGIHAARFSPKMRAIQRTRQDDKTEIENRLGDLPRSDTTDDDEEGRDHE